MCLSRLMLIADRFTRVSKPIWMDEPLFLSKKGGALQRAQAWKTLNTAARAIGMNERIGTHTLRKTFGYWAYQSRRRCDADSEVAEPLDAEHHSGVYWDYAGRVGQCVSDTGVVKSEHAIPAYRAIRV